MKRYISLLLIFSLLLVGCSSGNTDNSSTTSSAVSSDILKEEKTIVTDAENGVVDEEGQVDDWSPEESYKSLDSNELLDNIEDTVYSSLIDELDGKDYYIENVEATYISKEYIEELSYNSKAMFSLDIL